MGFIVQTLPSVESMPSLYLFSLLPLLELVLFEPAVEAFFAFLAKLEAVAIVAVVFLGCFALELVLYCLFILLVTPLLSCFSSSSDLM